MDDLTAIKLRLFGALVDQQFDEAQQLAKQYSHEQYPQTYRDWLLMVCGYDNLPAVQWLLMLSPRLPLDENDYNLAFEMACSHGRLATAKWLHANCAWIKLRHNDHAAFKLACNNGRVAVAEWLHSLNPSQYRITGVSVGYCITDTSTKTNNSKKTE